MSAHLFVDESKNSGFLMVAVVVEPSALSASRRDVGGLLLKGQERLHFTQERSSRRRKILTVFTGLDLTARVYDARGFTGRVARRAREECLNALVADAAPLRPRRLVIERDESVLEHDRRVLFSAVRENGLGDCLTYDLIAPKLEPLLWVPDAIAWCWAKGGHWKERVAPLVTDVTVP